MLKLEGKKILITGGSRGIGKACVDMFVQAGADVVFTYKSNAADAGKIISKYSPTTRLKAIKTDLGKELEIKKAVEEAVRFLRGIDVLVNNAGIWKYGRADKMSLEDWNETINLNLTGTFLFTREVLSYMKKRKCGKIINISSTAGQRGEPFHSQYAASKGGMIAFTKSLAAEFGRYNINVNCIAPGWVITDMTKRALTGKDLKEALEGIPIGRVAVPEDISGAVLFLASELARHITGEIININGGSVLCG
jgi:3-oxoacyl-[acyl-carrier protein] reductase